MHQSNMSTVTSPRVTFDNTFTASVFGAIFAINSAAFFIDTTHPGDLLCIAFTLGIASAACYAPIALLYKYMAECPETTYSRHLTSLVSLYIFLTFIFKWLVMISFAVFTRWLPNAFAQDKTPEMLEYILFLMLVFFAAAFTYVASGSASTGKPSIKHQ
jgi:signal transduction histidine kinase